MLISFAPDGRIEFTRTPTMLSLFPDDTKRIERMTDIVFEEEYQRYSIRFLQGPTNLAGQMLSVLIPCYHDFQMDYGGFETEFKLHTEAGGLITFDTYEDAVKGEIRFVEFLRDLGYSMTK